MKSTAASASASAFVSASLALIVVVFACAPFACSAAGCGGRDCNPPSPFSALMAVTSLPTTYASTGFREDWKSNMTLGHKAVIDFMGGVSGVNVYLLEPKGLDAAYEPVKRMCADSGTTQANCWSGDISNAKAGSPFYYRGMGAASCACSQTVSTGVGLYYGPGVGDTGSGLAYRAVHEYTHAVQGKFGDYVPQWLMEGGAVQMECVLSSKIPAEKNPFTGVNAVIDYAKCMESGGGGGGVIGNTMAYYASAFGKDKGLKAGEDRCCGDSCGNGYTSAVIGNDRNLYYDTGAMAIAFAVRRAKSTSAKFWTSKTEGVGFWGAIVPWGGLNYQTDHSSAVPEGMGWKKAFAKFTGDKDMTTFYAAFDAWAKTATKADMLAMLETDAAINNMTAVKIDITAPTFLAKGIEPCGTPPSTTPGATPGAPPSATLSDPSSASAPTPMTSPTPSSAPAAPGRFFVGSAACTLVFAVVLAALVN